MYKQLVVSHYEQDLTWVKMASDYLDIVIYDKSGKDSTYSKLENIGREPHTYMHHIIENYDSLAEWTIFAQDNPFEHVNNWSEILFGDESTWHHLATSRQKGGYFFSNMGLLEADQNGAPHHRGLPIAELWNKTFTEQCPLFVNFTPSCHFIIHRDSIRMRSIAFYENIKNILEDTHISPWTLERYISYIFNPAYK